MKILRLSILGLAVMLGGTAALADDLNLGGNFVGLTILENGVATAEGGGPISPSFLNGSQLAYVYCVGLYTNVGVPGDYADTTVSHTGMAAGTLAPGPADALPVEVEDDGQIAWLLDHFGASSNGNTIDEQALQAAIWTVEYNGKGAQAGLPVVTVDGGQPFDAQYLSDLAALGTNTDPIGDVDWFSPSNGTDINQALVGGFVPEPTSILLMGTILLFSARSLKRKKLGLGR